MVVETTSPLLHFMAEATMFMASVAFLVKMTSSALAPMNEATRALASSYLSLAVALRRWSPRWMLALNSL